MKKHHFQTKIMQETNKNLMYNTFLNIKKNTVNFISGIFLHFKIKLCSLRLKIQQIDTIRFKLCIMSLLVVSFYFISFSEILNILNTPLIIISFSLLFFIKLGYMFFTDLKTFYKKISIQLILILICLQTNAVFCATGPFNRVFDYILGKDQHWSTEFTNGIVLGCFSGFLGTVAIYSAYKYFKTPSVPPVDLNSTILDLKKQINELKDNIETNNKELLTNIPEKIYKKLDGLHTDAARTQQYCLDLTEAIDKQFQEQARIQDDIINKFQNLAFPKPRKIIKTNKIEQKASDLNSCLSPFDDI